MESLIVYFDFFCSKLDLLINLKIFKLFYTYYISHFIVINNTTKLEAIEETSSFNSGYDSCLSSEISAIKTSDISTDNLALKILKRYSELLIFLLDRFQQIITPILAKTCNEKIFYSISSFFKFFKAYDMGLLSENLSTVTF